MKVSKEKIFKQKGQSLIEVMIALFFLLIILGSLSRTILNSLKNTDYSRNKNIGLSLAQNKLEEIKNERETLDWDSFWDTYFTGSVQNPNTVGTEDGLDANGETTGGIFSRKVIVTDESPESPEDLPRSKAKIIVLVSWNDSLNTYQSLVSAYLSKW